MKISKIIFWQVRPSPHQASWIRALARKIPNCQVICIFQKGLSQERINLGWQIPDYGNALIISSSDKSKVEEILSGYSRDTVHVFSSMMINDEIRSYFSRISASPACVGILSEGRDWRGWKGILRQAHAVLHERRYRKHVDFVLAMGGVGVRWFHMCGYDPTEVFSFCYVVETPEKMPPNSELRSNVQVAALGQLIQRKRFDLLINGLKNVGSSGWHLKIIGDGVLRTTLESMADNLGLGDKIVFTGALDNHLVRRELNNSDLLVLPSRWDGWGAVVNEALMSGVPVICSDFCGAADLIKPGFNGDVFRYDSLENLIQTLNIWINQGPFEQTSREKLVEWSSCITGETVAQYFVDIVEYIKEKNCNRPITPWAK